MGALLYKKEPTGDSVSLAIHTPNPSPPSTFPPHRASSTSISIHLPTFSSPKISSVTFFLTTCASAHEVTLRFAALALHEYCHGSQMYHGMHVPGLTAALEQVPCKKRSCKILEAVRSLELPCTSLHTSPELLYKSSTSSTSTPVKSFCSPSLLPCPFCTLLRPIAPFFTRTSFNKSRLRCCRLQRHLT